MSNIIPPMVSSSPPPMDDNLDDDEDDEFGDFASANLPYDIGGEDDDQEDYVEYGTALEPLDEDAPVRKKPFSLEDQVAKDSHGRRRFHGAFTGGFSAGFFNTVGSLEGWTPSSFKSSRLKRAETKTQNPKDFMDDEDMSEFGIAPNVLRTTSDYDGKEKKRKYTSLSDGPIPGKPVLEDLLQPVRETVGIKLLRKMGWKPGQGVGPRVSQKEKKQMKQQQKANKVRVYGCALPGSDIESSDDDDEHISNITFAPDDNEQFLCKPKDNVFGIGYSGLDRRPVLAGHINLFEPSSLIIQEKKTKVAISGQAFGVGAFEDDDEDIYAQEDMTQYDFSLAAPSSTRSSRKQGSRFSLSENINEILEGFVHGCTISSNKRFFPPPVLPRGYQALHHTRKSHFEPNLNNKEVPKHQAHMASDRAAIVQETSSSCPSQEKQLTTAALKITEKLLPVMSGQFKPFANNPDKQRRYEQYTALVKKENLSSLQPLDMTEWEKERERTEFEQAAKLFKPLSGAMSDRFVSAKQPDDTTNLLAPVDNLEDENHDRKMAVKMKMFGRLTREKTAWQPCSILCKRFNIAEPNVSQLPSTKKPLRFSVFDYLEASPFNKPKINVEPPVEEEKSNEMPVETETEKQEEIEEPEETPIAFSDPPQKIDLYKAIFLSSSDESEIEEEAAERKEENIVAEPKNVERNMSSSRDVFANLDLDAISVRRKPVQPASGPPPQPEIVEHDMSPPRGVFANLDLDAISVRRKPVQPASGLPPEPEIVERNRSPPRGVFANLDLDAISVRRKPMSFPPPEAEIVERNMSPPRGVFANLDLDAISVRRKPVQPASGLPPEPEIVERNMSPPRGVFANLDLDAISVRRKPVQSASGLPPEPEIVERNRSPPRGVFANLDLDAISVRRKPVQPASGRPPESVKTPIEEVTIVEDDGIYGPRLPIHSPPQVSGIVAVPRDVVVPQGEWVEKRKKHKSKHHKKEKHKKSFKHKSKKSKRRK